MGLKIGDRVTHAQAGHLRGTVREFVEDQIAVTWEMKRWSTGHTACYDENELVKVDPEQKETALTERTE